MTQLSSLQDTLKDIKPDNTNKLNPDWDTDVGEEIADIPGLEKQKGYLVSLHSLEEKLFGSKSFASVKMRVFSYIKRNTLGWKKLKAPFLIKTIAERVGACERQVQRAIHWLKQNEWLFVEERYRGKHQKASYYGLHPSRFQDELAIYDTIIFPIEGKTKKPKKPKKQKMSPGGDTVVGGGVTNSDPNSNQNEGKNAENSSNSHGVNQSSSSNPSCFNHHHQEDEKNKFSGDKRNWDEVKTYLVKTYPNETYIIDKIYSELATKGKDDYGNEITCLPALLLKGYEGLKKNRSHLIDAHLKKQNPKKDEPIEESSFSEEVMRRCLGEFHKNNTPWWKRKNYGPQGEYKNYAE